MKKLICASLVMSSVLCSLAYADTSTLKPGLWENKVIKNVVDGKDMSAKSAEMMAKYQQAMEKMTPEQRDAVAYGDGVGLPRHGAYLHQCGNGRQPRCVARSPVTLRACLRFHVRKQDVVHVKLHP